MGRRSSLNGRSVSLFVSRQLGQSLSTQLSSLFCSLPLVYHVPPLTCNSRQEKTECPGRAVGLFVFLLLLISDQSRGLGRVLGENEG